MNSINNVLLVANITKKNVKSIIGPIQSELQKKGIQYSLNQPSYFKLNNKDLLTDFDGNYKHKNYDLIIAVGGDGTFLYAARTFIDLGIPIMGINAGRMGFLMEVNPDEFHESLDKISRNEVDLIKRMLLCLSLKRAGKIIYKFTFLNDAVVSKGVLSRMVEISLSLEKKEISKYRADGLIVSTPTGSTAYNLAAGGPILTPDMEAMIITPICPHILGVRPIVTDSKKELEITMISGEEDTTLTVDGQENFYLCRGDIIKIKKHIGYISIFDYGEKQFFSVLREKLGWHL